MDNHQQQMMNEAARQFTDALATANKATADRTMEAQQLGAQLTEYFFNTVINNLRTQAEGAGPSSTASTRGSRPIPSRRCASVVVGR
jgi:hypothetical protein